MLVAGIIMIPYPGPGWLVVFTGLAILSTEFAWARRLLDRAQAHYDRWNAWQRRQHGLVRLALLAATGAVVLLTLWLLDVLAMTAGWLGVDWAVWTHPSNLLPDHVPDPATVRPVELLTSPELWIAFASLLLLEIVLGIDNVVFISILADKLPAHQQRRARTIGLLLALVTRILLLLSLSWLIGLTAPLFTVFGQEISGRDLILIVGGLFLLGKSTYEIHDRLEGADGHGPGAAPASFAAVITQIVVLDVVFSLDSVITAVGMVDELFIMVAAVMLAIGIMLLSVGAISDFVNRHPTVKMLALAFLLLIGASLIAEGFDAGLPKGYVYGPIAFAILVEILNLRYQAVQRRRQARRPQPPTPSAAVHLRPAYVKSGRPGVPLPARENQ